MPTIIEIARAYILRGEAYSALQEHFTEGGFKDYTDGQQCMDRIKAIPAADVKPVIHAHWYVDNGCAYCSNCRNNFKKAILKEAKYCPKCGAQIDGYGGHPDAGPPTPYDLLYEEGGPDA